MISKNQIKLIRSLQQKKYREEHGLFIAEGEKVVVELIHSDFKIHSLYITKEFLPRFQHYLKKKCYEIVTEKELSQISNLTTPQGILAVAEIPKSQTSNLKPQTGLILLLDEIKDPGNLGTIIRIADWFGIESIVCSEKSVDAFNPKVVQASMGSVFYMPVFYFNLIQLLKKRNEKLTVYGATLDGKNIYETKIAESGYIIIGNESRGISKELLPYITQKISIPSFSNRKIDSLNAAIATAIICAEFRR